MKTFEIVNVSTNGKEFIDSLPKQIPDIVILDLEMPEMDGIKVTEYLYKNYPEIKILIFSNYTDEELIIHSIEKGAKGFLDKNMDEQVILDAVLSIVEIGYYFNEKVDRILVERFVEDEKIKPQFRQVDLSERETEVIKLICKEYSPEEISQKLFISKRTVEGHINHMLEKVGVRNSIGLVMFAVKNNLHQKSLRSSMDGIKRINPKFTP